MSESKPSSSSSSNSKPIVESVVENNNNYLGDCCICMRENINLLQFFTCGHKCVCSECYFKYELTQFDKKRQPMLCPLCRSTVRIIKTSESVESLSKRIVNKDKQDDFFQFLRGFLRVQSSGRMVVSTFVETICQTYIELYLINNKPVFITVDMCEQLLQIALDKSFFEIKPDGHRIRNLLVALCENPWNVDIKVGGHGVCYHGNMGDKPSPIQAFEILHRNHSEHLFKSYFF